MKKIIYLLSLVAFASCSSNKYAAHFQKYDRPESYASQQMNNNQISPLPTIDPSTLVASAESKPVLFAEPKSQIKMESKTFPSFTKKQSKEAKKLLRKEIKQIVKIKKSENAKVVNSSSGWDHDLKLAAIFGAVGIVGLIIGGSSGFFYIIGGIAMIIGVVFFVKWLIRQ